MIGIWVIIAMMIAEISICSLGPPTLFDPRLTYSFDRFYFDLLSISTIKCISASYYIPFVRIEPSWIVAYNGVDISVISCKFCYEERSISVSSSCEYSVQFYFLIRRICYRRWWRGIWGGHVNICSWSVLRSCSIVPHNNKNQNGSDYYAPHHPTRNRYLIPWCWGITFPIICVVMIMVFSVIQTPLWTVSSASVPTLWILTTRVSADVRAWYHSC